MFVFVWFRVSTVGKKNQRKMKRKINSGQTQKHMCERTEANIIFTFKSENNNKYVS